MTSGDELITEGCRYCPMFLLRGAGRKSVSQMTLAQTVLMIGIGSMLVQPISRENIWETLAVGVVLVITLVIMEYFQVKNKTVEKLITGKSQVIIENGKIKEDQLKKLRITVDQIEMNIGFKTFKTWQTSTGRRWNLTDKSVLF